MRYRIFALLISVEMLILALLVTAGYFSTGRIEPSLRCLSQADVFSAFQDSMGALEHFPEGALAPLPMMNRPSKPGASTESTTAAKAWDQTKNESTS